MLYRIEKYIYTDDPQDFSDWVTQIDAVPYLTKNRDYSMIAEGYSFKLSNQCPITLAKGDKIMFWRDTVLVHNGIVDKVNLDEDTLLYRVDVKHVFLGLKNINTKDSIRWDIYLNPTTFLQQMKLRSSSVSIGGISYDLIPLKNLIECIISELEFIEIGVDWTNTNLYDGTATFQWVGFQVTAGGFTTSGLVTDDEVYFLPEQINCINQNGIFSPANITGDEMEANRLSLFELLSVLCSMRGISFVPKDKTNFYAVNKRTDVGSYIPDDKIYGIETEEEIVKATGLSVRYRTLFWFWWFGTANIDAWSAASVHYHVGDIVSYDGKYWRCIFDHISAMEAGKIPGSWLNGVPIYKFYWSMTTIYDTNKFYIEDGPQYNTTNESYFVEITSTEGKNPDSANWFDNLNPIIVESDDAWICTPLVSTDNSPLKYQKQAALNTFKKLTVTTDADLFIDASLKEVESIKVNDINNDTVEVEYVE